MFRKKVEVEEAGKAVVITKAGEDKIKDARKEHDRKVNNLTQKYKRKHDGLLKIYGEGAEKSKLKFWAKSKTKDITDPKYWILVNTGAIKEFIKYGSNKVLDQIRVRSHASIESREAVANILKNQKSGIDAKQAAFTLMIVGVVAVMAYVMISQFMNFSAVNTENLRLNTELGKAKGSLAACTTELAAYNPGSPSVSPPASDNTLEG